MVGRLSGRVSSFVVARVLFLVRFRRWHAHRAQFGHALARRPLLGRPQCQCLFLCEYARGGADRGHRSASGWAVGLLQGSVWAIVVSRFSANASSTSQSKTGGRRRQTVTSCNQYSTVYLWTAAVSAACWVRNIHVAGRRCGSQDSQHMSTNELSPQVAGASRSRCSLASEFLSIRGCSPSSTAGGSLA